ncbi:MAG: hypothetical protein FJ110_10390 [Deltaproteobacteria bacterium]|nr:hypothetical protein [Deltaproteobacteria bacterium]
MIGTDGKSNRLLLGWDEIREDIPDCHHQQHDDDEEENGEASGVKENPSQPPFALRVRDRSGSETKGSGN